MIISLSHEHDLDGLGSQAIIKRYFKEIENLEIELIDAQYLNFIEKIRAILALKPLPERIIITDLGFNEEFRTIFPLFEEAKNMGCLIYWFDHHLVEEEDIRNLEHYLTLYLNDLERCAAEIVKDYYLPEDPIATRIAELARDSDFNTHKFKLSSELQSIIGYNRGDTKHLNRKKLVTFLAEGDFSNNWFRSQLIELKVWYEKESKFALDHVYNLEIKHFGDILIAHANIGGGRIARLLKERFPDKKVYIGIDLRYNELTIHSEYINCRDFARHFDGGGHVMRAGFKYYDLFIETGDLNPKFISNIKKIIVSYQIE